LFCIGSALALDKVASEITRINTITSTEGLMGLLLVPPFWRSDASVGLLRLQEKRQQGIAGIHRRIHGSLEEIANPCPISSPPASSVEGCSLPLFLAYLAGR
jgi:hypothetical protein